MIDKKLEFIKFILPHAIAAIGKQHGFLIRWGASKAAQECGWDLDNVLITRANNCLGIKGGEFRDGRWLLFGVPIIYFQDSVADGQDDGRVPWRRFDSLDQCFGEFVRMLNDRNPYHPWREKAVLKFEEIYAARIHGHAIGVLEGIHEVTATLEVAGLCDRKGRMK